MSLQVRWPDVSVTKQKALEDAKKMQNAVFESCTKAGKQAPQYELQELVGKGSFGRVYKATAMKTGQLVAVKIIDIEESDTLNPKLADTYSDLLKEINALQLLSDSGAKNINHVIEALPVGQSMWMVTEYCAGGSVATLMRPTAPGGLLEKWIIPIVREVAEAIHWVHGQGIIHRDLKCANVLVTETGDVQLCDFGVAGVIETKVDKRTTFIGTPHWMAPELFDKDASYGTEVDIWAFGAMVYEIASGLPPNVTAGIDFSRLGSHLKHHTPRLEGDQYSAGLRDLVSYCLQHDAAKRPTIEQVQLHRYVRNTEESHPTSSLVHLVRAFKLWEAQGGDRRSLFSAGGAQGLADLSAAISNDEWNFSTTAAFDQQVLDQGDAQDVYDVYGSKVEFNPEGYDETSRPQKPKSRRRPPPHLPSVKAPLEKIFDPNTISTYEENSRAYYSQPFQAPISDLPLRDETAPTPDVRESLIDLDVSLHGGELSQFVDLDTIKPSNIDSHASLDYDFDDASFVRGPMSDPIDLKDNRRTQDWKFPSMAAPVSADPQEFKFPFTNNLPPPDDGRPALVHHAATEPPYQHTASLSELSQTASADHRASVGSLIDLDMSFADSSTDFTRPSTSHSDVGSISGSEIGGGNPFELEKHASLYVMNATNREPSIYISDDSEYAHVLTSIPDLSLDEESKHDDSHITREPNTAVFNEGRPYSLSDFADMDPELPPEPAPAPSTPHQSPPLPRPRPAMRHFEAPLPPLPAAPMPNAMLGQASPEEVRSELRRLAMSLGDHLTYVNSYLSTLPVRRKSTHTHYSLDPEGGAI
ncbi:protein kinase domain-containing protein [Trichoderma breve]|uniref:non-specific serine/threonine protein kinase n=1 Tax=Trichoderma breve TaxID=2034170 RepID=A0A9W9BJS2_9HYPO|nr:protein kinase domain-containing protein [Trichoderma breve]KAJ4861133.1 protein kinase domain-containing protein [Trichoderma breve]